jgi:NADH-quinone oxidoreductase subunit F
MSTILNNPANAVLAKFASTGNETCFHDRHINPQIYADLNGSNWSIKDYEARGLPGPAQAAGQGWRRRSDGSGHRHLKESGLRGRGGAGWV